MIICGSWHNSKTRAEGIVSGKPHFANNCGRPGSLQQKFDTIIDWVTAWFCAGKFCLPVFSFLLSKSLKIIHWGIQRLHSGQWWSYPHSSFVAIIPWSSEQPWMSRRGGWGGGVGPFLMVGSPAADTVQADLGPPEDSVAWSTSPSKPI